MKEPKEKIKRHDRTQNNKQMDDIYILYVKEYVCEVISNLCTLQAENSSMCDGGKCVCTILCHPALPPLPASHKDKPTIMGHETLEKVEEGNRHPE